MNICIITECPSTAHSRGLCHPHYRKLKRSGELETVALPSKVGDLSKQHRITGTDEEAGTATCSFCGPQVPVVYRASKKSWVCRVKKLEGQKNFLKTQIPIVFQQPVHSADGLCAICKKEPATHLDHCHTSGVVRGILCRNCNLGLGYFSDDIGTILAAIEYLASK